MQEFWTAAAQIGQEAWLTTVSVLTSWLALRIYAGALAIAITAYSLRLALRQSAEVLQVAKFRGRKPKSLRGIEKRLKDIRARRIIGIKELAEGLTKLVFFGFLVPSIFVGLLIYNFSWFRPGEVALILNDGCTTAHTDLSLLVILRFVASQIAMGVTEGHVSGSIVSGARIIGFSTTLQPANSLMAGTLIGYRYFTGTCGLLFLRLAASIFLVSFKITEAERELEEARKSAT